MSKSFLFLFFKKESAFFSEEKKQKTFENGTYTSIPGPGWVGLLRQMLV